MPTQPDNTRNLSTDAPSQRPARWRRRRPGRIAGPLAAGVALPLALLGSAGHPAPAAAKHPSAAAINHSLLSAAGASTGDPLDVSAFDRTPHGYVLNSRPHWASAGRRTPRSGPPAGRAGRQSWPTSARSMPPFPARPEATTTTPAAATDVVVTGPQGRALGAFVVTCYDLEGRTATGAYTNSSTVAVDPSVIPLGSRIYVAGVGTRIAEDTGGAIVGRRLDIWEPTAADCAAWGVQDRDVSIES